MPSKADKTRTTEKQTIEQLQKRYADLNTRKITAEANLINAQKRLSELQKQARETYGTDDISELQSKLEQMTEENESKRRQYQHDLDQIEADLGEVEKKYAMPDSDQANNEAE